MISLQCYLPFPHVVSTHSRNNKENPTCVVQVLISGNDFVEWAAGVIRKRRRG